MSDTSDTAADIVDSLAGLSEEFPNWTIKLVDSFAPCRAVRNDAEPLMLGAASCAGLRALLKEADGGRRQDGSRDAPGGPALIATPERPDARLAVLRGHMADRGFAVKLDCSGLTVEAALSASGTPRAVRITCRPRGEAGGRLWFWTHWGEPLAEADEVIGAAVAVTFLLTVWS